MTRPASVRETVELPAPPRIQHPGPGRRSRRQWTIAVLMVFAFLLAIVFGTPMAPHAVKPGKLSSAHAQILASDLTAGGCTMCHGNVSADLWLAMQQSGHAFDESDTRTMTERCVACHHDRIPSDFASSAHNLPAASRLTIAAHRRAILLASAQADDTVREVANSGAASWLLSPAISQDAVACSVCHREHHGADEDLKSIADARCQTCHQRKFGSFAQSHPEFTNWPVMPEHGIAFDHAKHANVHFPKTAETATNDGATSAAAFDCRACHRVMQPSVASGIERRLDESLTDPIVATLPFEIACASCHDASLKVEIAGGPALIELPILPPEIARQIESWPASATGSPDGKLSAWMLLLLRDQDPATDFTPLADLARVDWQSRSNRDLALRLARAIREFTITLSLDGQSYLFEAARRSGADEATAKRLAGSFPTQLMSDAAVQWFGTPPRDVDDGFAPRGSGLTVPGNGSDRLVGSHLGSDLGSVDGVEEDDDLLTDFSQPGVDEGLLLPGDNDVSATGPPPDWEQQLKQRFDAARSQSLGGWYHDNLTLAIRYRGSGHDDVVLKSLIEMAATHTSPQTSRLRAMIVEQPAVAACVSCHTALPWRAGTGGGLRDRMTRFTHRPHLDIAVLQNCEHCHTMRPLNRLLKFVDGVSAKPVPRDSRCSDFLPLQKASCVHCHTADAAGDHCTTCHRYHVGDVHSVKTIAAPAQPVR